MVYVLVQCGQMIAQGLAGDTVMVPAMERCRQANM
jgi:hypothetical protein